MAAPLRVSARGARGRRGDRERPGGAVRGAPGTAGLGRLRLERDGMGGVGSGLACSEGRERDGMGAVGGGGSLWCAADDLAQRRLLALGGCGLLLGSALAAGDERLYAAVMPALRALPPEAAHGLALRAAALGLLPPARPDGPALVRLSGAEEGGARGPGQGVGKSEGRPEQRDRGGSPGPVGVRVAGSPRSPWRAMRDPRAGHPVRTPHRAGEAAGSGGRGVERGLGNGSWGLWALTQPSPAGGASPRAAIPQPTGPGCWLRQAG